MSSVDVPIVRPTITAAPKDYEIPAAQEIAPLAVRAFVDGTGAGAPFRPALQLISPGGQVMWTAEVSDDVAAGASADVSWFPRVGGGGAGGADPHAIHYDTNADTGGFVDSRTTTGGYSWADKSGSGWSVDSGISGTPGFTSNVTNDGQAFEEAAIVIERVSHRLEVQNQAGQARFTAFADGSTSQPLEAGAELDVASIATGLVFVVREDGQIAMPQLPIVDPGVSGRLWNNGGVLNVSP